MRATTNSWFDAKDSQRQEIGHWPTKGDVNLQFNEATLYWKKQSSSHEGLGTVRVWTACIEITSSRTQPNWVVIALLRLQERERASMVIFLLHFCFRRLNESLHYLSAWTWYDAPYSFVACPCVGRIRKLWILIFSEETILLVHVTYQIDCTSRSVPMWLLIEFCWDLFFLILLALKSFDRHL